ncbi:type VII toxin-antitoxin system MntA family adenylyltransferase antitoxin [Salinibius halmophilus]|uniref:type VII toxin-antitoxin system MntA family adenylyltransferase antitoxin n=1 Tax=Salinibius halmophilus TaxID=1853216 RepID=UPI000E66E79F|nr:nucleotidyltransferase domain-containing protein [Salinibius halmophilus]
MIDQETIILGIKRLAEQNDDIAAVWLYGSRAKGTSRPNSDFDIAVAFNDFSLDHLAKYLRPNELALDWQQSLGLTEQQMSVIDISLSPTYLALNVVESGMVIYSDNSSRVYRETARVRSLYEFEQVENR